MLLYGIFSPYKIDSKRIIKVMIKKKFVQGNFVTSDKIDISKLNIVNNICKYVNLFLFVSTRRI